MNLTACPDPSTLPYGTVDYYIAELCQYGIIAYAGGLPTSQPNACTLWTLQHGRAWTVEELQRVLVGVKNTAKAFYMLKNNLFASSEEAQNLTGDSLAEKQLFKLVMDAVPVPRPCNGVQVDVDGFYLLRVGNDFQYGNANEYCDLGSSNEACTSNANHAIALYGTFYLGLDFIEYTFVHELGHRFDNQSGLSSTYLTTRANQTITDCHNNVVMGYIERSSDFNPKDWLRGSRGWGDINTSSNMPTYFQQNTLSISYQPNDNVPPDEQTPEISEGMADMFLNWVYRRITDKVVVLQIQRDTNTQTSTVITNKCAPLNIPNQPTITWETVEQSGNFSWNGFRNIQPPGVHDSRLPGNARYWWIDNKMCVIFERMLKRLGYLGINETLECKP